MKPCPDYLDDLALAAGADLSPADERRVLSHAEACEGCAVLLAGLVADQGLLARAAIQVESFDSLLPIVMARVATEAHVQAVQAVQAGHRQASIAAGAAPGGGGLIAGGIVGGSRAALGPLGSFFRMTAAVAAVISVGLLGLATLQHEQANSGPGAGDSSSVVEGAEISVRRLPGEAIELSWVGDGREGAEASVGKPYTVLASADPRDFQAAKAVEVAGRRLVTDLPLPVARAQDRKITYFRVQ